MLVRMHGRRSAMNRVLSKQLPKRAPILLGGARCVGNVPPVSIQDVAQIGALELVDDAALGLSKWLRPWFGPLRDVQVAVIQSVAVHGHDGRSFDGVLQLADVTRPRSLAELRE